MIEEINKTIGTHLEVERILGHIEGSLKGPTLIFMAGIHGNEPAGIYALKTVLDNLNSKKEIYKGNFFAISGNISALKKGIRYNKKDLNRIWTQSNIQNLEENPNQKLDSDSKELRDIYTNLNNILETYKGPYYFFDLHTTSSQTVPFITVNDSILNRKFTAQYPVPIILGIEEYLEGALLSYINELGYIAFGFEGGQHTDFSSIANHIAFIYLSMVFCGSINKFETDFDHYYSLLYDGTESLEDFYEIFDRYEINSTEDFKMKKGFNNFQTVKRGQLLAISNVKEIVAKKSSKIFMPLYQGKGNDGFFMIRKVPKVFLNLSTILRKIRFDKILPILPGIKWASEKKDELIVDLKVARFFTKEFLHLLGYRSRHIDKNYLKIKNREAASRDEEYK